MSVLQFRGDEGLPEDLSEISIFGSVVEHDAMAAALQKIKGGIRTRSFGAIEGPIGSGKTTTALVAARTLQYPTIYVRMGENPSPLHVLRLLAAEIFGPEIAAQNKVTLERLILRELRQTAPLLIIDEAGFLRRPGLAIVQYLYDSLMEVVPLLLVGAGLTKAIDSHLSNLGSRIDWRQEFTSLQGDALGAFLLCVDPRLAASDPTALQRLDYLHCKGQLRAWGKVIKSLDRYGITTPINLDMVPLIIADISGREVAA